MFCLSIVVTVAEDILNSVMTSASFWDSLVLRFAFTPDKTRCSSSQSSVKSSEICVLDRLSVPSMGLSSQRVKVAPPAVTWYWWLAFSIGVDTFCEARTTILGMFSFVESCHFKFHRSFATSMELSSCAITTLSHLAAVTLLLARLSHNDHGHAVGFHSDTSRHNCNICYPKFIDTSSVHLTSRPRLVNSSVISAVNTLIFKMLCPRVTSTSTFFRAGISYQPQSALQLSSFLSSDCQA
jgi:hypothetical protein